MSELIPQAKAIALLVNPNSRQTEHVVRDVQEGPRPNGVQLPPLPPSSGAPLAGTSSRPKMWVRCDDCRRYAPLSIGGLQEVDYRTKIF